MLSLSKQEAGFFSRLLIWNDLSILARSNGNLSSEWFR